MPAKYIIFILVLSAGLEPATSCMSSRHSDHWVKKAYGGTGENRTRDPLLARQMLSQLSYGPIFGSGGWSWTSSLWVMSPTRYHSSTPRQIKYWLGKQGSNLRNAGAKIRCLTSLAIPQYWSLRKDSNLRSPRPKRGGLTCLSHAEIFFIRQGDNSCIS